MILVSSWLFWLGMGWTGFAGEGLPLAAGLACAGLLERFSVGWHRRWSELSSCRVHLVGPVAVARCSCSSDLLLPLGVQALFFRFLSPVVFILLFTFIYLLLPTLPYLNGCIVSLYAFPGCCVEPVP